ncbi:hypothetical protein HS125_11675 [bacterium]|nr:hypothetical protein [bacterium]
MSSERDDGVLVRPYRPTDRDAVRDICCRTACRNLGCEEFFSDRELFADYFTRYYTDFEPESALVAEMNGRTVAYLTGARDSRRFLRYMSFRIMPALLGRLAWRWLLGRYRRSRDRRFLRWLFLKSWREAVSVPLGRFPAHFHINLLAEASNRSLHSRMARAFVEQLERAGCTHLHALLLEPRDGSVYQRLVAGYERQRPGWIQYFREKPTDVRRDVLGDPEPMVNRAYGFALADYSGFLEWLARRYGL